MTTEKTGLLSVIKKNYINHIEKTSIFFVFIFFVLHFIFQKQLLNNIDIIPLNLYFCVSILVSLHALLTSKFISLFLMSILWYSLFLVNPFIDYISFLPMSLFLMMISLLKLDVDSSYKKIVYVSFLFYMSAHYFLSALVKALNYNWSSGAALEKILSTDIGRDYSKFLALNYPQPLFILTILTILVEFLGVFLLYRKARTPTLIMLFILHLGIAMTMKLLQLTIPYFLILSWIYFYDHRESRAQHD